MCTDVLKRLHGVLRWRQLNPVMQHLPPFVTLLGAVLGRGNCMRSPVMASFQGNAREMVLYCDDS